MAHVDFGAGEMDLNEFAAMCQLGGLGAVRGDNKGASPEDSHAFGIVAAAVVLSSPLPIPAVGGWGVEGRQRGARGRATVPELSP